MSTVHLHFWAGARAAAGTATDTVEADTVRAALAVAGAGRSAHFRRVAASCTLLVDGLALHEADLDRPLSGPVRVEVLPPFAGGAQPGRWPTVPWVASLAYGPESSM